MRRATRPRALAALAVALLGAALASCAGDDESVLPYDGGSIDVRSPAFPRGGKIPARFAHERGDVSPPLAWSGAPEATKEFAVYVDDPDAPSSHPFVHWVAYRIPVTVTSLPEGIPLGPGPIAQAGGALQGKNDFGEMGWGGPDPPAGERHKYVFWVYALDAPLALEAGATRERLIEAMKSHVLANGKLIGTYAP